jgi:transcriptional regulator with XRE-family HTH domain
MLRKTRKKIGATLSKMSRLLGLEGENAADRIRAIESGKRDLTGPMKEVLRYLNAPEYDLLPKYMICEDIDKDSGLPCWIFHTQYPKFVAVFDIVDSKIIFIDRPIEPYWEKAVKEIRKYLL